MRSIGRNVAGILAPSLALVMAVSAAPVVAQAVADGRGPEGRSPVAGAGADAPVPPLAVMPWAMPTYEIPALVFETDWDSSVQDDPENGWVLLMKYGLGGALTGLITMAVGQGFVFDSSPWWGALVGGLVGAGYVGVYCALAECEWSRPRAPPTRRRFPPGVTHLGVGG
jgi:hypothetical protein